MTEHESYNRFKKEGYEPPNGPRPALYCGLCEDKFCVKSYMDKGRVMVEGLALTPTDTSIEDCQIRIEYDENDWT